MTKFCINLNLAQRHLKLPQPKLFAAKFPKASLPSSKGWEGALCACTEDPTSLITRNDSSHPYSAFCCSQSTFSPSVSRHASPISQRRKLSPWEHKGLANRHRGRKWQSRGRLLNGSNKFPCPLTQKCQSHLAEQFAARMQLPWGRHPGLFHVLLSNQDLISHFPVKCTLGGDYLSIWEAKLILIRDDKIREHSDVQY